MTRQTDVLKRIESLPSPRHLFVLPDWAIPGTLDRLMDEGYVTCGHRQYKNGALHLAMNLNLTPKAQLLIRPSASSAPKWPDLLLKGSVAGLSLTGISVAVLYLA